MDDLRDLFDRAPFRQGPAAPLRAVHRPELAVRVGPLVPDGDAALLQPADVGLASQEPEQLVDDRLEMNFLGGQQRKAGRQVESHLPAEGGQRAGARAVVLSVTVLEHVTHEIEVLLHRGGTGNVTEIIARGGSSALAAESRARPTPPPGQTRNRRARTPTQEDCSRAATRASGR